VKQIALRLWNEEEGQDLLEYALLIALVVLVAAATVSPLGQTIANIYTSGNTCATNALNGTACT
jgi:Flp pilus assembly pilin Flp